MPSELTVVIPTHGRATQVEAAVRSALQQQQSLEVLVVDDGSPIPIRFSDERVRVVRLVSNQGAAAARNAGIRESNTEWVALLDSDDVWTPHSLAPRFNVARASGDIDDVVWSAGFAHIGKNGRRKVRLPRASSKLSDFVSGCWSCPGSTALFSRRCWERSGGQDAALRRLEDYDWLLRWAKMGGRLAVHEVVAADITRSSSVAPTVIKAAVRHILQSHQDLEPSLHTKMRSYLQLELAASALRSGMPLEGLTALADSWFLQPRLHLALEPFWRMPEP